MHAWCRLPCCARSMQRSMDETADTLADSAGTLVAFVVMLLCWHCQCPVPPARRLLGSLHPAKTVPAAVQARARRFPLHPKCNAQASSVEPA
jgi:hypothetical protein